MGFLAFDILCVPSMSLHNLPGALFGLRVLLSTCDCVTICQGQYRETAAWCFALPCSGCCCDVCSQTNGCRLGAILLTWAKELGKCCNSLGWVAALHPHGVSRLRHAFQAYNDATRRKYAPAVHHAIRFIFEKNEEFCMSVDCHMC